MVKKVPEEVREAWQNEQAELLDREIDEICTEVEDSLTKNEGEEA